MFESDSQSCDDPVMSVTVPLFLLNGFFSLVGSCGSNFTALVISQFPDAADEVLSFPALLDFHRLFLFLFYFF